MFKRHCLSSTSFARALHKRILRSGGLHDARGVAGPTARLSSKADQSLWSRLIGAFPVVEMENKPSMEDIFRTLIGRDVVVVGPFLKQKFILPFWHILHLIFAYNIESRKHTIECPIARGELILYVARGGGSNNHKGPAPGEPQLEEQPPRHNAGERLAWADAFMTDLKVKVDAAILPTHQL
ncbi:hypothetical protein CJ030_MR2G008600 [Morella rubra]|uniref:Uncharacterized protein n=1 Tax=Morella rubra TaxID=262757 RepID=A0A6A1WDJ1_9ROSI|nr:hypothetical protein CJ030_MR2G008600 [Morella rubra]